jgi:hypothetical protein
MAPLAARRRAAALTLTAALVAPAAARVFTGSVGGQQFPFLAKFAFGVDGGGGPVGTVSLSYANQDPSQTAVRGAGGGGGRGAWRAACTRRGPVTARDCLHGFRGAAPSS